MSSALWVWFLICVWMACETFNFLCHCHFNTMSEMTALYDRMLDGDLDSEERAKRTHIIKSISDYAIVQDFGFSLVTCADLFWEFLSWVCICFIMQTSTSFVFLSCLFFVYHNKAQDRHRRYKAEYKQEYLTEGSFIPYFL